MTNHAFVALGKHYKCGFEVLRTECEHEDAFVRNAAKVEMLQMLLVCGVCGPNKAAFVNSVMSLSTTEQTELMNVIKDVMAQWSEEDEESEEEEEEEEKLSVSMSCEFLRVLQHYLNDNDVKLEIKARDDKDTPGSGFFMDRERFKTSLKGIFQGPVDISAVTNFVTNAYLVNNGEMGGDVSDDESTSSSSGVSQTLADKFARGMRDAVRYIEQEMAARNRRQRTMFGLIRDIA